MTGSACSASGSGYPVVELTGGEPSLLPEVKAVEAVPEKQIKADEAPETAKNQPKPH
jgi:hypothetical protein